MGQKFYADPKTAFAYPNGAVGYSPGDYPFVSVGLLAKVKNCPINGTNLRLTCYATAYPDTAFSVPACTRYKGKYIRGFFSASADSPVFHPLDSSKTHLPIL